MEQFCSRSAWKVSQAFQQHQISRTIRASKIRISNQMTLEAMCPLNITSCDLEKHWVSPKDNKTSKWDILN